MICLRHYMVYICDTRFKTDDMKMKYVFCVVFASTFWSACTTYTKVEQSYVQKPTGEFVLPASSVVLVNNTVELPGELLIDIQTLSRRPMKLQFQKDTLFAPEAMNILGSQMIETDYFDDVLLYDGGRTMPQKADYYLADASIETITNQDGSKYLLSLDSYNCSLQIREEKIDNFPLSVATLIVVVSPRFSLYKAGDESYYHSFAQQDTFQWSGTGNTLQEAINDLSSITTLVNEASYWTMQNALKQWIPYTYLVERQYIHHRHNLFMQAKYLLQSGRKKEAAALWRQVIESNLKEDLRFMAACNLALYAEEMGDVQQAIEWIDRALQLDPTHALVKEFELKEHKKRLQTKYNGY